MRTKPAGQFGEGGEGANNAISKSQLRIKPKRAREMNRKGKGEGGSPRTDFRWREVAECAGVGKDGPVGKNRRGEVETSKGQDLKKKKK